MQEFFYSKEILFSIAAGAIVALTVEGIHWFFRYKEKQQIQTRISQILSEGYYKIKNAKDFKAEMDTKTQLVPADIIRNAEYKNMERNLSSILSYTKGRLNLEDERNLRYKLLFVEQFPLPENTVFPLKFYEQNFFAELEKEIKWLDFKQIK